MKLWLAVFKSRCGTLVRKVCRKKKFIFLQIYVDTMAAAVRNSAEDCYVFSSPPKALLRPVFQHHQGASNPHHGSNPSSHGGNVLYHRPGVGHNRHSPFSNTSGRNRRFTSSRQRIGDHCDAFLPPVPGRQHMPVQTDIYLEELCDIVEENDVECQTDPLLDRPPSPLFVPAKSGEDVETQIYEGELFDFDREVQPILEVLVGQTLEQSLVEVMEEEELALLQDMQRQFEARRNFELAERQRLEEQERRLYEERQRRLKEQEEAIKLEEETALKVAACVFAQNYLSDLMPQVFTKLEEHGYIEALDPVKKDVEESFWPWLMEEVDNEVTTLETSCKLLDSLIEDAVKTVNEGSLIRPVTPEEYSDKIPDEPTDAENTEDAVENSGEQEAIADEEDT